MSIFILLYRRESGVEGIFRLDSPATSERIRMACVDEFTKQVRYAGAVEQQWKLRYIHKLLLLLQSHSGFRIPIGATHTQLFFGCNTQDLNTGDSGGGRGVSPVFRVKGCLLKAFR